MQYRIKPDPLQIAIEALEKISEIGKRDFVKTDSMLLAIGALKQIKECEK